MQRSTVQSSLDRTIENAVVLRVRTVKKIIVISSYLVKTGAHKLPTSRGIKRETIKNGRGFLAAENLSLRSSVDQNVVTVLRIFQSDKPQNLKKKNDSKRNLVNKKFTDIFFFRALNTECVFYIYSLQSSFRFLVK